jgi:transcriptional regulator with XRE-family HTH domain
MKLEEVIGAQVANCRGDMTQAELGERLGQHLGRPWSRQTVSAAEKGGRAFTAVELLALSVVLEVPLGYLFTPPATTPGVERGIEMPGGAVVPVERLLRHTLPGPEQESLIDHYAGVSQEAAGLRRDLAGAQRMITDLQGSIPGLVNEAVKQVLQTSVIEEVRREVLSESRAEIARMIEVAGRASRGVLTYVAREDAQAGATARTEDEGRKGE